MTDHIKGLLFDKDGTLFDFQTTWGAWANSFFLDIAGGDREAAAALSAKLGYDFHQGTFRKDSLIIAGTPDEVSAVLVSELPDWDRDALISHVNQMAIEAPQVEPVPLVPLLSGMRARGLKLGVATNDAEEPARAHLGSAGITELFDFIAGFDSGFGAKPEPGMLLGFCAHVGLEPDEVIMVGDSTHDLMSGRAAGMTTVAVLTGMAEEPELSPYADVVLAHVGEIPGWMGV